MSFDPTVPFTKSGKLLPLKITFGGGTARERAALRRVTCDALISAMGTTNVRLGYDGDIASEMSYLPPHAVLQGNEVLESGRPAPVKVTVGFDADHEPIGRDGLIGDEEAYLAELERRGLSEDFEKAKPYHLRVEFFGQVLWVGHNDLTEMVQYAQTYASLVDIVNLTPPDRVVELIHNHNFNTQSGSRWSYFDYDLREVEGEFGIAVVSIVENLGTPHAKVISNYPIGF